MGLDLPGGRTSASIGVRSMVLHDRHWDIDSATLQAWDLAETIYFIETQNRVVEHLEYLRAP